MSEIAEDTPSGGTGSKNRHRRIVIFVAVTLINVGLLVLLLIQLLTPAPTSKKDPLVGQPAPVFSLATLRPYNGLSRLSLANFKGKPIVLNFWASWCDPCKEESPLLERSWKQGQAQGKDVVFLGVDFQDSSSNGLRFLQNDGITYPIVQDTDGSLASKYGLTALPDTVFINRDGMVTSRVAQQLTARTLSSNLQLIV